MTKNYTLFIDTTNNYCYVALYNATNIIDNVSLKVDKNVTDLIVDAINNLLISKKVDKMDLTHLCVNIGPGSFTGDKVGVIVAKAWKLVNPKLKISVINSLLLQVKSRPAISIIDAKSNKLYFAVYGKTKVEVQPCCIEAKDLDAYLKKYKNYKVYQDLVDEMDQNYLLHLKDFEEVKSLENLEPLYLKHPVK